MPLTYGFCLDELSSMYDSKQFSNAFHAITGDGIASGGARLAVTINGFTATVASGYALAAGRWISNDEPLRMTIKASGNNEDRTDALVVRVNYQTRKALLEILVDIDLDKLTKNFRNEQEYSVVLYLIRVRRGSTALTPEDVTDVRADPDLCGTVIPLSAISKNILYIYEFLLSGIDREVDRILDLNQKLVDKANEEITKLDIAIQQAGGGPKTGDLQIVRSPPTPGWLLCDGSPVPKEYPALSALLNGDLPNISGERYRTYIFGGSPEETAAWSNGGLKYG